MKFSEAWMEFDYNPFISFDENGRVKSLNQEAHYLLGEVQAKEIFNLAKTYANITFGFKTTILDLNFGSFSFFAITVGYLDDSEIGIKLYKKATKNPSIGEHGDFVNIYSLLDLCISATSAGSSKIKHNKLFDPTFPQVRLKIEEFSKLINKIYQSYLNSTTITSKLMLNTGEYLKFEGKKYPIFSLHVEGEKRDTSFEQNIEDISANANSIVVFRANSTILSSALISN
ncbi:MAG: hypothetical protein QM482_01885 [Sulfurospirillum sp.]